MPLYDFKCPKCSFVKRDVLINAKELPYWCPKCALGPMDKLPTRANFRLVGDGFYSPSKKDSE